MKKVVQEYLRTKNNLVQYFDITGDYFLKPVVNYNWRIKLNEDVYFLAYWLDDAPVSECVIVNKGGKPFIVEKQDYTMVVGIECVKIGFILKNSNKSE